MVVSTELYASGSPSGSAATRSVTADSPLRHRIFISLSSASVSVLDFLGGIANLLILLTYFPTSAMIPAFP
jgi:hypothetical protein